MWSLRTRLLTLITAVVLILAISGPAAMANVNNSIGNGDSFDNGDLFGNGDLFHGDLFDDNNDRLDTIDVGPLECLVRDGDQVLFCVNRDTGQQVAV